MAAHKRVQPATENAKTVAVSVRMSPDIASELRELAREDQRSVAAMTAILLREAIAARLVSRPASSR